MRLHLAFATLALALPMLASPASAQGFDGTPPTTRHAFDWHDGRSELIRHMGRSPDFRPTLTIHGYDTENVTGDGQVVFSFAKGGVGSTAEIFSPPTRDLPTARAEYRAYVEAVRTRYGAPALEDVGVSGVLGTVNVQTAWADLAGDDGIRAVDVTLKAVPEPDAAPESAYVIVVRFVGPPPPPEDDE